MAINDTLPKYILGKKQMSFNVVLSALFSLVSALMLSATSLYGWFNLTSSHTMWHTFGFWLWCMIIIGVSRRGMYQLRDKDITILTYLGWCIAEMVVISLLYTFLTYLGINHGWFSAPEEKSWLHFINCMVFCILGLGIPNLISILYCAVSDRDQTIRLMNFGNVVSDTISTPQNDKRIMLYDNSGSLKLVINQNNLFYIESDDNYIKVWYQDSYGELKQFMLRCKLKTIEESFSDSNLVRCHRQYIVNINKIEQMIRQKDGSFSISLGLKIAPIPVSKTYEEKFIARFNSR